MYNEYFYNGLLLLGRWLYKTNAIHQLANHPIKKYWFITFCIFTLTYSMFLFCNFKVEKIQSLFVGLNYAAPLVILQAVFLFISFAKINLNSNFINWCSVSCLSIFLIHMHPAIKNIGYYAYTENLYDKPLCEHILILFALMIVVFVGSIIIDKVRIFFSDKVYSILSLIYKRIPSRVFEINTYLPRSLKNII